MKVGVARGAQKYPHQKYLHPIATSSSQFSSRVTNEHFTRSSASLPGYRLLSLTPHLFLSFRPFHNMNAASQSADYLTTYSRISFAWGRRSATRTSSRHTAPTHTASPPTTRGACKPRGGRWCSFRRSSAPAARCRTTSSYCWAPVAAAPRGRVAVVVVATWCLRLTRKRRRGRAAPSLALLRSRLVVATRPGTNLCRRLPGCEAKMQQRPRASKFGFDR